MTERRFGSGLTVRRTLPEHVEQLEELQRIVFPSLAPEQRFRAEHYLRHIELFPDGQLCVVDGARVVGMTSTIRHGFDFAHPDHTFADIIEGQYRARAQAGFIEPRDFRLAAIALTGAVNELCIEALMHPEPPARSQMKAELARMFVGLFKDR